MPLTSAMAAFILTRDPSVSPPKETRPTVASASTSTPPTLFVIPKPVPPAKPPTPPSDEPEDKDGGSDEEKSDGIPAALIGPLRAALTIVPRPADRVEPKEPAKVEGPKYEPNSTVAPKDTVRNQWGLKDRFGVMWRGPDKDTLERWVATRNATPDATAPAYYYPLSPPSCPGGRCSSR